MNVGMHMLLLYTTELFVCDFYFLQSYIYVRVYCTIRQRTATFVK